MPFLVPISLYRCAFNHLFHKCLTSQVFNTDWQWNVYWGRDKYWHFKGSGPGLFKQWLPKLWVGWERRRSLRSFSSITFFLSSYLFILRDRAWAWQGQRNRERKNPTQAPHCEQSLTQGLISEIGIRTWAEIRCPALNLLSYPGTPVNTF